MKKTILCLFLVLTLVCIANFSFAVEDVVVTNIIYKDIMSEISVDPPTKPKNVENPYKEADIEEKIEDNDLFICKDILTYDLLDLDGNAYLISNDLTIKDSVIKGNLFVFAKDNITFNNVIVTGSVYIISSEANLNLKTNDLYILGDSINLEGESLVERTAKICGSEINLDVNIGGNCYIKGDNIDLKGSYIKGNLQYSSEKEANDIEATIDGKVDYTNISEKVKKEDKETVQRENIVLKIVKNSFSTFIIAGAILLLSKKFVKVNNNVSKNLLIGFFIGIFAITFIPSIALLLIFTIIGIPIGIILFLLYVLTFFIITPIISLSIAAGIASNIGNPSNWKILGIAIFISIIISIFKSVLPFGVSMLFTIILTLIGFGIIIKTIFSKVKNETNVIIDYK